MSRHKQPKIRQRRTPDDGLREHVANINAAITNTKAALTSARRHGYRMGCITEALHQLEGAIDCVMFDDSDRKKDGAA